MASSQHYIRVLMSSSTPRPATTPHRPHVVSSFLASNKGIEASEWQEATTVTARSRNPGRGLLGAESPGGVALETPLAFSPRGLVGPAPHAKICFRCSASMEGRRPWRTARSPWRGPRKTARSRPSSEGTRTATAICLGGPFSDESLAVGHSDRRRTKPASTTLSMHCRWSLRRLH